MCILGILAAGIADAADLIISTNQGAVPGVRELAAAFSAKSGHKVTVVQDAGAALERRLNDGPGDLITGILPLPRSSRGPGVASTVTRSCWLVSASR